MQLQTREADGVLPVIDRKKKIRDGWIEIAGTTVLTTVVHVWITRRALVHLTGRDPGWRGSYAILGAVQAASYWADAGRAQRVEFTKKARALANNIILEGSRGQAK